MASAERQQRPQERGEQPARVFVYLPGLVITSACCIVNTVYFNACLKGSRTNKRAQTVAALTFLTWVNEGWLFLQMSTKTSFLTSRGEVGGVGSKKAAHQSRDYFRHLCVSFHFVTLSSWRDGGYVFCSMSYLKNESSVALSKYLLMWLSCADSDWMMPVFFSHQPPTVPIHKGRTYKGELWNSHSYNI